MKLMTVKQVQAVDHEADASGWSYRQMMEKAGRSSGEMVDRIYGAHRSGGVLGLVGSGHNGGDTLVALTYLAEQGWRATAYLVKDRAPDDELILRLLQKGGKVLALKEDEDFKYLKVLLRENDVLLDGVLGTGFRLPLKGEIASTLNQVKNYISESSEETHVVAVDCPSGIDCDTGECASEVVPAELTVTMGAVKVGLMRLPANEYCGQIEVMDIGWDKELQAYKDVQRYVIDQDWIKKNLPQRPDDANKGTFGSTLIVAGSKNFTGAAYLAAKAAYLAGSGLVTLAVIDDLHKALAGHLPEVTWMILPEKDGFIAEEGYEILKDGLTRYNSLLVGPGLGLNESTGRFVEKVVGLCKERNLSLIVDADGAKLVSRIENWHNHLPTRTILTPHPGEMSVLTKHTISEIQNERIEFAEKYAAQWGHIVVLKGAFTIVAEPGGKTLLNPVATAALARAGTGDVLAGLIAGLLSQKISPFESAGMGAWIHGQAGLRIAEQLGTKRSVLASDILKEIPNVFSELEKQNQK